LAFGELSFLFDIALDILFVSYPNK
jgi:hypothetical protein